MLGLVGIVASRAFAQEVTTPEFVLEMRGEQLVVVAPSAYLSMKASECEPTAEGWYTVVNNTGYDVVVNAMLVTEADMFGVAGRFDDTFLRRVAWPNQADIWRSETFYLGADQSVMGGVVYDPRYAQAEDFPGPDDLRPTLTVNYLILSFNFSDYWTENWHSDSSLAEPKAVVVVGGEIEDCPVEERAE